MINVAKQEFRKISGHIDDIFRKSDGSPESHIPIIDVSENPRKGQSIRITVSVGRKAPHPNSIEHHIRWIDLFFLPIDDKCLFQIGRFYFTSFEEMERRCGGGTVHFPCEVTCTIRTETSGTIYASSYCNIHGLRESSRKLLLV